MQASSRSLFKSCVSIAASSYSRSLVQRSTVFNGRCCAVKLASTHYSTEVTGSAVNDVIPPPPANASDKQYPQKIESLVSDISKLTLLEVADLNALLKITLNIQDAPMMAMGAMPAGGAAPKEEEEAEAPKREKTSFSVKLVSFDTGKKVPLIKEIKTIIEGLNLVQAKKFVESAPQIVMADIPKDEAEKLIEKLKAVGATVELE